MKKYILLLLCAALAFSCSSDRQAKINGSFAGQPDKSVYLELLSHSGRQIVDSTTTDKKGGFKFKVDMQSLTPTFYNIKCDNATIPLIVKPKDNISLSSLGSLDRNYSVDGSLSSSLVKEFNSLLTNSIRELDSLSSAYSGTEDDEAMQTEFVNKYSSRYYQFKRDHIKFIVSNAADMSAVYALYQRLPGDVSLFNGDGDLVYYQMVADSIETRYPDSPHLRSLREEIAQAQAQMDLINLINSSDQVADIPELRMPDMHGNMVSLRELAKGKVVLLDFWSLLDARSLLLNADLKELYAAQNANGFEVYQVSVDTEKAAWIESVQSQRLPWTSVCDFYGLNSTALRTYNIPGVPFNILIDREGNIAARGYYGDELEARVKSLLNQ